MKKPRVALVGATGMVGQAYLQILEERNLPMEELHLLASQRSAGESISFHGKEIEVEELNKDSFKDIDLAFFAAGGDISEEYAPYAVEAGAVVIDNSSHFRMDENVPLVVPEVNPEDINNHKGIIANPNCSTTQAMLILKPILDTYGLKRVIFSTYQAVSGAGAEALEDLHEQKRDNLSSFTYPIYDNCIPQIDVFLENGYTKEEMKMIEETQKILHAPDINITATAVRVPVSNGHSESINIETLKDFDIEDIKDLFRELDGVILEDDIEQLVYPMPYPASGKDEVFVGRIRRDHSQENTMNLFVVSDNIRKGAALNAIQIAELLIAN